MECPEAVVETESPEAVVEITEGAYGTGAAGIE
eukprot:CAMPEP_0197664070 /NCGR_PEP_ID=MMETSP1338-20131121/58415_1 /TAXON_ID=43686 ORGANISM="Pelagodinium beii, Strain RCC1491" /NCGR_SAMPLE_ID=MMETSP1338 /ASSEMBLY_ACC=CAM_ASM_000754 /LENGTH=32 /DNA_ID= /DNA_START= /DNA_END= /DNA_ORIENTATION=